MSFLEQTGAVNIKDSRISFIEIGKGEPILFLHGNPGTKRDFQEVSKNLAKEGYKCFCLDRPGHMNSEELIPETPDNWLDADVFAEFIDKKCSGKAILVGYSLGSFLASKVAIKYPEKVKKLVFVCPFVTPNDKNETPSSIPQLSKNPLLGTILGILLPLLSPPKMKKHLQNVFHPEEVSEEFLEAYLPRYTRFESLLATISDKNSMLEILSEVHEKLAQIECNTIVISGLKDSVCSAEEQNQLLKENLKNVKIVEIEDGGHGLPFTHAEKIAELIK